MNEKQFRDELHELLKKRILGYNVVKGENLLYKLMIDSHGKLQPESKALTDPKRGQLAFQTDILVKNDKVPLVVVELKVGGFSTHDVLTYSTKAIKHKEVYPYLRYGLVIGEKRKIDKRFFTHNMGFDFAVAIGNTKDNGEELVEIIKEQLRASECMLEILGDREIRKFVSSVEIS
ncbi:MAG: hypothetical protein ABSC91_11195 [Candidatus Bathyarchaeia archaeon]|jgi:hypothetical protein